MDPHAAFTLHGYADLIESLPVGMMVGSREGGVLLCNGKALEILGRRREDVIGARSQDPIWHFVREDGSPMSLPEYPAHRVFESGLPVEGLVMGIDRPGGGGRVWVLAHATPRFDARGQLALVVLTYQDISVRKRVEEALLESEARYRALFEHSPDGILIADPGTLALRFANQTVSRMLGFEAGELTGMSVRDLHRPEDLATVLPSFRALASGELDVATNVPCRRKDGTVFCVDVRAHVVRLDGVNLVVGRFLDITDRERAQRALAESEALKASEDRYRAVVEDQTDLIFRFRADGTIVFANEVFCRFFGRDVREIVGDRWQPTAVPEDLPIVEERLRELSPSQPVAVVENRVVGGEGQVRWLQFVNRGFFDPTGRLVEIQAVARDVTDLKRAQQELARHQKHLEDLVHQRSAELVQSEERYRRVVEMSPDAILVHTDEIVVFANRAAATLFRVRSPATLLGMSLGPLVHPDCRDDFLDRVRRAYRNERHARREDRRVVALDGAEIDVDSETVPISYGGRPSALSIIRDCTVQRRLDREIRNSQKLESVGLLAGGIAHDFNNLLAAILGNLSLARMLPPGSPDLDERLREAEKAVDRATALTQQLLTFSRGGAPVKQSAQLGPTIGETADFALRGSNVACRFDIAPDLWPADVDVGQISQVVHNIVVNGRQAMPDGGTLHVGASNVEVATGEAETLPEGRYVRVSIRDGGPGIAPENLERIFDPYFTTKPRGNGLGLAVCHSIVRQHGGAIRVQTDRDCGTTFHVYLPASRSGARPSTRKALRSSRARSDGRLLIMDDAPDVLNMLARLLESLGYRVDAASDGRQALDRFSAAMGRGRRYDAVIVDLTVPGGMGGKETAARLHELDPSVPVIVTSGYSEDPILSDFKSFGFHGALPKPFRVDTVAEVLDGVLGRTAGAAS